MLRARGEVSDIIRQSFAVAEKDIREQLRFKFQFFGLVYIPALINLALFGTIFFGFVKGGTSTGGVNQSNFVTFTILGALSSTLFNQGFGAFQGRFASEKARQTILATLASPLSTWSILFGASLAEGLKFFMISSVFLTIAYLSWPIGAGNFLAVLAVYLFLYLIISGLSLIRGALFLVNENFDPIITFFSIGTSYVSCFYYPASFLPSILQPLALINPVYYVVNSARSIWLSLGVDYSQLGLAVAFAVISPLVGTWVFRKVWRNLDISGF